ncbi:hypothetical protein ACFOQM_04170 [Paenibacillus sp. GCM10012307]|uniref:Uncharacterized protein n=1 Tax=Paenibacillus roseus TaxID=2798579 RepID=A0A934IZF2_9BACL|nr:hypothetical protein [Paenibacillus roseus]
MSKKKRQLYNLSAKVEFSPEAEQCYLQAKNKSDFIRKSIEHYVHHVMPFQFIQKDLDYIKNALNEIKEKGVAVSAALPEKQIEMSSEDNDMEEQIQFTLGNFLNMGALEGGEKN